MLIFKSNKKILMIGTIILIILYSLNNVFLSYILSNMIAAVTRNSLDAFFKQLLIGIIGFLVFMIIGIILAKVKTKLVMHHNLYIKKLFLEEFSYNDFDNNSKNISFMINDLKQLETKGIETEFTFLSLFFTVIFAFLAGLNYDILITVVFFVGSIVPLIFSVIFKKGINQSSEKWLSKNSLYTRKLKDYFNTMETIKTYNAEDFFINETYTTAVNMETSLMKMNKKVETTNQILYIIVIIFSLLVPFGFGVLRVIEYSVPLASFIGVVYLSNSFRGPMLQATKLINEYSTIKNIKDKYLEVRKKTYKKNIELKDSFESLEVKINKFKFNEKLLFNNQRFVLNKNDKILVLGQSGIGKSTLLRIIQQRIKVVDGEYIFNNKIIEKLNSNQFSFINQKPISFNDTVLNNITLGKYYSQEELDDVIKKTELTEFIKDKGFDFVITENDSNISLGELQRIEIARALITKRPIILADEITSSLDNEMSKRIRKMLIDLDYTVIEVAHKITEEEKKYYNKIWKL